MIAVSVRKMVWIFCYNDSSEEVRSNGGQITILNRAGKL